MLPDLPELKRLILRALQARMNATMLAHLGPFKEAKHRVLEEGDSTAIVYPDGRTRDTEMREAIGEVTVTDEVLRHGDLGALLTEIDKAGAQMAEQQAEHGYRTLAQISREVGTAVDNRGMPLSADAILAVLEKIQIDFSDDGPSLQLVMHPEMRPKAEAAMQALESDPALKTRFEVLMVRKREEFLAREARRQLVG